MAILKRKKKSLGDILSVFNSVVDDLSTFVDDLNEEKCNLREQKSEIEHRLFNIDDDATKAISVKENISKLVQ